MHCVQNMLNLNAIRVMNNLAFKAVSIDVDESPLLYVVPTYRFKEVMYNHHLKLSASFWVVWTIICVISLIIALTLLCLAWISFRQNPTILVTDSNHYPIWNYNFPAVTVCDMNRISKKRAYNLATYLIDNNETEDIHTVASDIRLLIQLMDMSKLRFPLENFARLQKLLDKKGITTDEAFERLSSNCMEMLVRCIWKGEEKRCESIFERIKTTEGYCCSFNYFALKNHTFSGTLAKKAPKEPRRISACGYQTGLEVIVNNDRDDYFASLYATIGHNILIHNSYSFPDWNVHTTLHNRKIINLIGVSPTKTYCSDDIENMAIKDRNCLFPNERQLIHFQQYTYNNCMTECRINLTKIFCNCMPFFNFDARVDSKNERICSLRDVECLLENDHMITSSVPGFNFSSIDDNHVYGTEKTVCDCPPNCRTTKYSAESSSGTLNKQFAFNQPFIIDGIDIKDHSIFRVFFNDLVGIRNRLDVRFNWHTLLAYYGGLLGLFLGFSFVGGIEIVYFFTVRMLVDVMKNKKRNARQKNISKIHTLNCGKFDRKKNINSTRNVNFY